ncbi:MAG: site-specific DNA-methyltransferase [Elusimicrobiota bacterium]|jgi:DNA modification methylase|nr:site-specific DNA-methyltransferase [Elusimicrobiota bacterium]
MKKELFVNNDKKNLDINKIYQGDCLEILRQFPDNSIDLIFADPPYNMQLKKELYRPNNTKVDGVNDEWDKFGSFEDYDKFSILWLKECKRVLKDSGTIWVIGSYHNIFRVGNIMLNLGYWILNDVTWHKTNPMPNFLGTRFTNATETLLWCSKGENLKKYTFNHKLMKQYNGGKQMTSVWNIGLCIGRERIKGIDGKKAHSTQKPEELLKRVILSTTEQNDIVLDPFFGTGTTGAVAKKLGRNFIGIEREKEYIKIAQKRIDNIKILLSESSWIEPKKEKQTKVPFANLVKNKIINSGEFLYTRKRYDKKARVLDNGNLSYDNNIGSIHRIGAIIQQTPSCNGWKFWYALKNKKAFLIDDLREEYIRGGYGL